MPNLPEKKDQILQAHAGLIHRVVVACSDPDKVPDLQEVLTQAEENGWEQLVSAIRKILFGSRDEAILNSLDEEDRIILDSILRGLQDPSTLPDLSAEIDPNMAAPSLAATIHAVRTGNTEALDMLATMATQMSQAGGDMAKLAAIMRPLSLGERDPDLLCKDMSSKSQELVMSILRELGKLEGH